MQLELSGEGESLTVRPHGRLEAADSAAFIAGIEERLATGSRSVTIDLGALEFLNFGGIRAILQLARSLKGRGTELRFSHAKGQVWEALDLSGLDDIFPFENSGRGSHNESIAP